MIVVGAANGIVPINDYMRQLEQVADQLEWDGNFALADYYRDHKASVQKEHQSTGILYYPMF